MARKQPSTTFYTNSTSDEDDDLTNTSDDDLHYVKQTTSATKHTRVHQQLPPSRNAANARERARMRVLARAFCRLKTTLPWVPADTKLSKLDTLRLATSYIAYLREVLLVEEEEAQGKGEVLGKGGRDGGKKHPVTLSWPFSFGCSTTSGSSTTLSDKSNHNTSSNHHSTVAPSMKQSMSHQTQPNIHMSNHNNNNNGQITSLQHDTDRFRLEWRNGKAEGFASMASTSDLDLEQQQLMACQHDKEVSYY